jgi:uncharacterized protein YdeI (YjbR/CyaY-like superfamily)
MATQSQPRFFRTPQDFRAWLEQNAHEANELIVGFWKVDSGKPSMSWSESVDEALCFGWIDAVRKRIDDESYLIRFTRRKPTSIWSAVNIAKFHALEAEGRMMDAGRAAFAHRTDKKSVIYSYEKPGMPELAAEEVALFKRNRAAWKFFESTPPSYRKKVIARVLNAKRPETRAARLQKLIEASAEGVRLE